MIDETSTANWQGDLVDAYAHLGRPKYGSLPDIVRFFSTLGMCEGVLVLGPGIPDLPSVALAREWFGDRIRVMGIPFGATEDERLEFGEIQMRIGISGMRIMPFELEQNRDLVERLGAEGLWLFAINPFDSSNESMPTTRVLLDWLERHPAGRVASPHFLRPCSLEDIVDDIGLLRALLLHPRYHAILSRFGGAHSALPYPHRDLRPWVEQTVELVTWRRLLWGSEFPIFHQRSEHAEAVRDRLLHLGVPIGDTELTDFYAGNARRLFFSEPPRRLGGDQVGGGTLNENNSSIVQMWSVRQAAMAGVS